MEQDIRSVQDEYKLYAILVPPLVILVLILLMALEGDYTFLVREEFFTDWSKFFTPSSPH